MPFLKRSKSARDGRTAGLKPKKRITAKQRAARKRNIEIARKAKKKGTMKHFKKEYKHQRATGMPKSIARNVAFGVVKRRGG